MRSAHLDRVEPHHDDLELAVPVGGLVLDRTEVRLHGDAGDALHDELRGDGRFWPPHVGLAEEELPVEVRDVDRVHVDDVNLAKAGEREVLEELAAQSARADHEHARVLLHEREDLGRRLKGQRRVKDRAVVADVGHRPRPAEQLLQVREGARLAVVG